MIYFCCNECGRRIPAFYAPYENYHPSVSEGEVTQGSKGDRDEGDDHVLLCMECLDEKERPAEPQSMTWDAGEDRA